MEKEIINLLKDINKNLEDLKKKESKWTEKLQKLKVSEKQKRGN